MDIKGCIFDLDGVIVDTAKYHYLSWLKITEKFGFSFTENDNERLKGISRMQSLEIILDIGNISLSQNEKEKLCAEKNDIYLEQISQLSENEVLPGVRSFLEHLKSQNLKVALGSASKNATRIINTLEMDKYFDALVDGNHVTKSKPDPEVFLKGAHQIDLLPKNVVVFEDSRKGLEAAITAGFIPIGVGEAELLPEAKVHISTFEGLTIDKLKNMIIPTI